jgi:hypothetical protein
MKITKNSLFVKVELLTSHKKSATIQIENKIKDKNMTLHPSTSAFLADERAKTIFASTIYATYQPSVSILEHIKRWIFGINELPQ